MQELLGLISRPGTTINAAEAHAVTVLQVRLTRLIKADQREAAIRELMPEGWGEARKEPPEVDEEIDPDELTQSPGGTG